MDDESTEISGRTWLRAANSINKVGYMDGASDGQTATFQSSFNSGFELGVNFGFTLGYNKAMLRKGAMMKFNQEMLEESIVKFAPTVQLFKIMLLIYIIFRKKKMMNL